MIKKSFFDTGFYYFVCINYNNIIAYFRYHPEVVREDAEGGIAIIDFRPSFSASS
jgi:hypothetical protein